jgi:hypothetical protein
VCASTVAIRPVQSPGLRLALAWVNIITIIITLNHDFHAEHGTTSLCFDRHTYLTLWSHTQSAAFCFAARHAWRAYAPFYPPSFFFVLLQHKPNGTVSFYLDKCLHSDARLRQQRRGCAT